LRLRERAVFVFALLNLLLLKLPQPLEGLLFASELDSDRQGIDKQPYHRFDARQFSGPPGDYCAEDDLRFAAVTTQQQRPCGLRNRVQGQLMFPRKGLQPDRLLFGKPLLRRLRGAVAWRD